MSFISNINFAPGIRCLRATNDASCWWSCRSWSRRPGNLRAPDTRATIVTENGTFQELELPHAATPFKAFLRICNAMRRWRRALGTLLILTPLLVHIAYGLFGVLLGSMGMDIHWTSKGASYVAITCSVLLLGACVVAGVKLRNDPTS
jgi:hypothetical protein